ncbi:3-isopropylmalate dehydrogenase, partial [Candidatus Nitromaritima sp. SCGC AAA799-C22]
AGQGLANPLATILSVGMMFKYSFEREEVNTKIETAVESVLGRGIRTPDIMSPGMTEASTREMGDRVIAELENG